MMIVKAGLNTGTNNPHSPYVDLGVELIGLTGPLQDIHQIHAGYQCSLAV